MSDYRPVSVLPVVGKIFEKLVHQRLYSYLTEHSILHPAQHGFRPNHTTQDVLVSMIDNWRRQTELADVKVRLNENPLPRSKDVKCLGVWIDDCLTWKRHIDFVRKKSFHGVARIRRLRSVLPTSIKTKLYKALVLPHLDYCSVVWQECTKDLQRKKVERIQNYGMRLILSKPPRTPSEELRLRLK